MTQPAHAIAQQSYSRCLRAPDFFSLVYDRLLASDPSIPPMFEGTEFPRQHKLLQHGIGLLLSYAKRPDPTLLERIAARHSVRGADVSPSLYPKFVDSLLHAVRAHDPKFTDQTDRAWRDALEPGIAYMASRYDP